MFKPIFSHEFSLESEKGFGNGFFFSVYIFFIYYSVSIYVDSLLFYFIFFILHIHNDIVIIYNTWFSWNFWAGQFEIILLSFSLECFFVVVGLWWYCIGFRIYVQNSSGQLKICLSSSTREFIIFMVCVFFLSLFLSIFLCLFRIFQFNFLSVSPGFNLWSSILVYGFFFGWFVPTYDL